MCEMRRGVEFLFKELAHRHRTWMPEHWVFKPFFFFLTYKYFIHSKDPRDIPKLIVTLITLKSLKEWL